ncbi:unnamed protein product, partial [Symbiodinium sp. KB8]
LQALQFLSETLRRSLLKHMELQHMQGWRSYNDRKRKREKSAREPRPAKKRSARSLVTFAKEKQKSGPGRGICIMRSGNGVRVCYFARAIIAGIAISSHCVRGEEEAKALRDFLDKVSSSRWQSLMESDPGGFGLRPAFEGPCQEAPRLWRFRATVDARRWVGRTLSSRQVASLGEALELKQQLEMARQQGWPALKAAWIRCMQTAPQSRRFGHRAVSFKEAEAKATDAERRAEEDDSDDARSTSEAQGMRVSRFSNRSSRPASRHHIPHVQDLPGSRRNRISFRGPRPSDHLRDSSPPIRPSPTRPTK